MATTNNPRRVLSAEQTRIMLLREDVVLRERASGKSFYRIEREHEPHKNSSRECECGGLANADRIWKRAIARFPSST